MVTDRLNPATRNLSAAVLAGGESRRMGTDKALMTLDGQTLLERTLGRISSVADDVMIVGDRLPYHHFGVPVIADLFPGAGPLGGIATALRYARHGHVLIVACDLPMLSPSLLAAMAEFPRDYDVLIPLTDGRRSSHGHQSTFETLHAIYRKRSLPAIERQIAAGELQVAAALEGLRVQPLPVDWLRGYDPDLRSFVNANEPGDWIAAKAMFGDESSAVEDPE